MKINWIFIAIATSTTAIAEDKPLPADVQKAIQALDAARNDAKSKYDLAITAARMKASKAIDALVVAQTKAGNLDNAVKIKSYKDRVIASGSVAILASDKPQPQVDSATKSAETPTRPANADGKTGEARPDSQPQNGIAIDLMPKISIERDTIAGSWTMDGTTLVGTGGSYLSIPVNAGTSYDFSFDFQTDSTLISAICSSGERMFQVGLKGWSHKLCGIRWIDGVDMDKNPTSTNFPLSSDQRYNAVIQVRPGSVRLLIDAKEVFVYNTDFKNLSDQSGKSFKPGQLGLFVNKHTCRFFAITLTKVGGGKP